MAGIALAATVGCGFTAQLGAMRISEEIDAVEVMAIPSMQYLVSTRIVGGLIAIIPLYVVGLLSSYFATRLTVIQFYGQSAGTYDHYFNQFLPPGDVLWSFGKVLVFAVTVILIHCYYGYTASGGPAGVGVAVGRAVRTSIVAVNVIDLFLHGGADPYNGGQVGAYVQKWAPSFDMPYLYVPTISDSSYSMTDRKFLFPRKTLPCKSNSITASDCSSASSVLAAAWASPRLNKSKSPM